MPRKVLDESRIHPAIRATIASHKADVVREVEAAVDTEDIVVVGMAMNPFPRKARRRLDAAGLKYRYLEFGSYLGDWRRRNALKMWTGWPTFPMVFVKGTLVGGAQELARLQEDGDLAKLLAAPRTAK